MKVLIVYATTEGQTRKIAQHIAARSRDLSHEVTICDSGAVTRRLDIKEFDAVFIAGSVHQERHQDSIIDFVIAHKEKLQGKTSAFISVSLSAVLESGHDEAQGYVNRFMTTTNWKPDHILLLGGALRFGEYDYFKQQIVKHIVMKRGDEELSNQDYEFTDWEALDHFVDETLGSVSTK